MKKLKTKLALTIAILALNLIPGLSLALDYNLNNIDLRLSDGSETIQINGQPGENINRNLVIRNYSDNATHLKLSAIDAEIIKGKFSPSETANNFNDASKWITLAEKEISLNPGESKTVGLNIKYPTNAGVGKHFAAIMALQQTTDNAGNLINLETGIRLFANVSGVENGKYKLINPRLTENQNSMNFTATIVNSGNTNLNGMTSLINQASAAQSNNSNKVFLKPGEDRKINLTIPKTSFGPERIVTNINIGDSVKTFVLSDKFNIPNEIWILLGGLILGLTALTLAHKKGRLPVLGRTSPEIAAFATILLISLAMTLNLNNLPLAMTRADTIGSGQESAYLVTVKWGNLTNRSLPEWIRTNWEGHLAITEGQMYLVEKLHNENSDQFYLNSAKTGLNFKNITGPDNDGIIILVKPTVANPDPVLTIHNLLTGEEIPVILSNTLQSPRLINYKQHQISVSSEPATAEMIQSIAPEQVPADTVETVTDIDLSSLVTEIQSSPDNGELIEDLEATPDETVVNEPAETSPPAEPPVEETVVPVDNSAQIEEELKLLKSLITEIPASPDVISQYVLNSSYVEEVSSENNTTTVISSPILIDTLKDTPLTIQELTSTPDLNYIFLPNEKVKLTSQDFSFTEQKISSQELNEIVFVQRKNIPWTAYMSITNLVSISGNGIISADNININPGKIYISNQTGDPATIEAGTERRLFDQNDQIVLTSITPNGEGETTFSIRPKISVRVPANTPPGLYRGTISIKVI